MAVELTMVKGLTEDAVKWLASLKDHIELRFERVDSRFERVDSRQGENALYDSWLRRFSSHFLMLASFPCCPGW